MFVFTQRRHGRRVVGDGLSIRYSAIALLGLNGLDEELPALPLSERHRIARELLARGAHAGLGDAALIAWAASGYGDLDAVWRRLAALAPVNAVHPTIEVAWSLAALILRPPAGYEVLTSQIAEHLMAFCDQRSGLFPHLLGGRGARSHVASFADQVYPIHALSLYAQARGDDRALAIATHAAQTICERQGADGQWWWHYDVRTGAVIEGYPVYAIHQDAMAPLALRALSAAGGPRLQAHLDRGLAWLACAPELNGGSLVDGELEMVWRKVARHEPRKASRSIQAVASRLTGRRASFVDAWFPPGRIDYEDRPYHWGWLLNAWADGPGHRRTDATPGDHRPASAAGTALSRPVVDVANLADGPVELKTP